GGGEQLEEGRLGERQGLADSLRPFGQKPALPVPEGAFGEPASRLHPWGSERGQLAARHRRAAQAAAVPSAGSASLASFTRAANASASLTAISASMRRSTSISASFRPWMRRL